MIELLHLSAWVFSFLVLWLACGFLSALFSYNYFQLTYPCNTREQEADDFRCAFEFIWLGPIILVADWSLGYCSKGLTFRRNRYDA